MEEEIKVCPVCGNTNFQWVGGGLEQIGISSVSGKSRCIGCGNVIIPIYFKQKDYKKFLEHLKLLSKK
ncbi:hypothetical protein KO317_01960 [Candidatus Micrarchaeota archaeon]|nr:hypothetical protein [Candidatus Micrarchaeota archaeon]